jgi:hypothetical protein
MLSMKQRREPRFETAESICITIFGEPDIQLPARVRNVSARGIGIELQGPVAVGAALKIEIDDTLLLGEVIYCRQDEACFYVGVELEHSLCGLEALAQNLRDFSGPPSGTQPADAVKNRSYQDEQQPH